MRLNLKYVPVFRKNIRRILRVINSTTTIFIHNQGRPAQNILGGKKGFINVPTLNHKNAIFRLAVGAYTFDVMDHERAPSGGRGL